MQITITARHFELSESIRDYAEKSIRGLKKYFEQIIVADMILSIEKNRNIAELNVKVKKLNLVSKSREKDMYAAIDSSVKKMERQVKRHIGKLKRHHPTNSRIRNFQNQEIKTKYNIYYKNINLVELDVNSAIDVMNSNNEPYIIFRKSGTKKINLIKKVNNGYELSEIQ
ncbi:MAG: ribosome-associated translation inhibitor RaiA [Candidatus Cloacimonetes bacterium]|nr:ribosome-associated translation inhibitor RaiA [Candidatus Cloacimonadota bacterium]MBL7085982.1 ribosome-associated translation inhibitor RaiA [Candidatus Cloacimonadota bacterium]